MRSGCSSVSSRRSLSAPCATIRHVCSLTFSLSDESGYNSSNVATAGESLLLSAEMVEAAAALANPRLHAVTRAAALFPNFSSGDTCMTHNEEEEEFSAQQHLANSQDCRRRDDTSEPVLFDRLNAASSQINLLNRVNGHTVKYCAELEETNKSLSYALKQALDENKALNERLNSKNRELDGAKKLVAELKKQLAACQQGTSGSHNS
ncbi:uncharacterized protein TM35_000161070 [Trypanosoma theileri]|uniref:Uncharacterized protein n=1 Tax=Trypanosoma theileri TaxID=67003 RepID=A0A1X0NW88_9TRYP|nr:uncharacterized protein TM35_000161070 [Trypanosoma theileri]ORC88469.1 hypothetical protein TM35_000161070 [Trypanosoma theileri]